MPLNCVTCTILPSVSSFFYSPTFGFFCNFRPDPPRNAACAEEAERQLNESGGGGGKAGKRRKADSDSPLEDSQHTEDDLGKNGEYTMHSVVVDEEDDASDGYK